MLDQFWIATNPPTVPLWLAGLFYLLATQDGKRWVASLSSRRALVIRRTTWMALAIGALVDAAMVLPIAPPGSSWWRFAE